MDVLLGSTSFVGQHAEPVEERWKTRLQVQFVVSPIGMNTSWPDLSPARTPRVPARIIQLSTLRGLEYTRPVDSDIRDVCVHE